VIPFFSGVWGRQTRFSTAVDKNGLFRYKLFGMVIESHSLP
jgi:hypothetical protein